MIWYMRIKALYAIGLCSLETLKKPAKVALQHQGHQQASILMGSMTTQEMVWDGHLYADWFATNPK